MEIKVLKGGKANDVVVQYDFIDASVTDTRLMGVLGLHLVYLKKIEGVGDCHVHYFLYYDIEEIGLDNIKYVMTEDPETAYEMGKSSFGGLGAKMIKLSEMEALHLVKSFIDGTKQKKKALPIEIKEIQFIIDKIKGVGNPLGLEEIKALNQKICTEIHNDFGLINYYIMRCIGLDYEGARLVCDNSLSDDCFENLGFKHLGTFLQNSIETFFDENGEKSYLCQSLIDTDNSYKLLQSELKTNGSKVISAKKRFVMPITIQEASFMLSTSEYVTVYEIYDDSLSFSSFDENFKDYSLGFTNTRHESGTLYMEFNPDNLHAEKQEFHLSDDVKAIYFVTDYGQLIVGAYSLGEIEAVEKNLAFHSVNINIDATAKYQFSQSVIYEFALSGMCDFEEFVKMNE